ncbi:MAG TPA: substrate-binding domain-containing protein [Casimicrobiaceae bacterium]
MAIEHPNGEPITGISSMAMRHVLAELADAYTRQTGQRVDIVSVGGVDAARRVADGEAFDFVVLSADVIERLAAGGRVDPGSRIDLARSDVAIAVATGARRPEVGSESAIRDAVLQARNIGYSTGPSGAHLARLFERWGIADAIAPRVMQAPPGIPVGTLVARGDVELGFQQLSELMHLPGIDVIGLLPAEIQAVTVFSAAVCTASRRRAAAAALLSFLASPQADATKLRHGMDPALAHE